MAQDWHTLDSGDALSTSRGELNENFATIKSMWAGSSAPSSPVDGQAYANTNTWGFYIYKTATGWLKIADISGTYGGLLPTSAGASYPLSDDLYCGGHQIKNVAAPSAATDVVTKTYAETTLIDGHEHGGSGGDGPKLDPFSALSSTGYTEWAIVGCGEAGKMAERNIDADNDVGTTNFTNAEWTTVATVTVGATINQPKLIVFGGDVTVAQTGAAWRLRRDTNDLIASTAVSTDTLVHAYKDTAPGSTSYEYHLDFTSSSGDASTVKHPWLVVI